MSCFAFLFLVLLFLFYLFSFYWASLQTQIPAQIKAQMSSSLRPNTQAKPWPFVQAHIQVRTRFQQAHRYWPALSHQHGPCMALAPRRSCTQPFARRPAAVLPSTSPARRALVTVCPPKASSRPRTFSLAMHCTASPMHLDTHVTVWPLQESRMTSPLAGQLSSTRRDPRSPA